MKVARLKHFFEHLRRDRPLVDGTNRIEAYWLNGENWLDSRDQAASAAELLRALNRTVSVGTHWRYRNDTTAYFYLRNVEAVVVVDFPSIIQSTTRHRFFVRLNQSLLNSNNQYDATHDHLTGLRNRSEFDRLLLIEAVKRRTIATRPPQKTLGEAMQSA